jgi:zinc protease
LIQSVVTEQGLAEDVDASFDERQGQSTFSLSATAQEGHTAAEVEQAIEAQLAKLLTQPPSQSEIDRARARLQTRSLTRLEDLATRAWLLNQGEIVFGNPGEAARQMISRLDGVTPSGTLEIVRRVLVKPRLTITFVPKGKKP